MQQRPTLIIATALTAFLLVFIGGLVVHLSQTTTAVSATTHQTAAVGAPGSASPGSTPDMLAATISPDTAATAALGIAPGAALTRTPEMVNFQGTVAYEVSLDRGTVYVDATSGQVLYDSTAIAAVPPADSQSIASSRMYDDDHEGEHEEREDDDR